LKEGARLVDCAEDVLEELAPQLVEAIGVRIRPEMQQSALELQIPAPQSQAPETSAFASASPVLRASARELRAAAGDGIVPNSNKSEPNGINEVLNQLKGSEKLHVDSIIEGTGLNAQTVLKLLLELELGGRINQHPGKLFSLI